MGYIISVGPVGDKNLSEPEAAEVWVERISEGDNYADLFTRNYCDKSYTWFYNFLTETGLHDVFCRPGEREVGAGKCVHILLTPETVERFKCIPRLQREEEGPVKYYAQFLTWILFWYNRFEGRDGLVVEIN